MYSSFCIDFGFISVSLGILYKKNNLKLFLKDLHLKNKYLEMLEEMLFFSNNLDVHQSPNFQKFSPSKKIIMSHPTPLKNNYVSIIIILLKVFKGISNKLQFSHKLLKHYKEYHTYDRLILFFSTVK